MNRDFGNGTLLGKHSDRYVFSCGKHSDRYAFSCWDLVAGDHGIATNSTGGNARYSSDRSPPSPPPRGKFDYLAECCFKELDAVLQDELDGRLASLVRGYDWLVVKFGIHEIIRAEDCRQANARNSAPAWAARTLDLLARVTAARAPLRVAWLTTGTKEGMSPEERRDLDALNAAVRDWFARANPALAGRVRLVDWARQLAPRADDARRIRGDMKPHWGFPARLLAAQMVAHAVATADDPPPSGRRRRLGVVPVSEQRSWPQRG